MIIRSISDEIFYIFDHLFLFKGHNERKLIHDLRKKIRKIPYNKAGSDSPAKAEWDRNMSTLRKLIINNNPRRFLQWNVIKISMFCGLFPEELTYLKSKENWQTIWKNAIIESKVGLPDLCEDYPQSSGNLIHHAYHLAQFEEKTGQDVSKLNTIIEFGGGYGSMCRLFFNLGFSGKYIIYDLPAFSAMQEFYLGSLGLKICKTPSEFFSNKNSIICVSEIEQLNELINTENQNNDYCFLATWSISETSLETREPFLPFLSNAKSVLISYQDRFGEVDNVDFFEKWVSSINNINCSNWPIEHIPGSHYLIGKSIK